MGGAIALMMAAMVTPLSVPELVSPSQNPPPLRGGFWEGETSPVTRFQDMASFFRCVKVMRDRHVDPQHTCSTFTQTKWLQC